MLSRRSRIWRRIDKAAKIGAPRVDVKRHEVARNSIPHHETSRTPDAIYNAWEVYLSHREEARPWHPSQGTPPTEGR